ncbi:MAG TPA: O-antigen ligase family protein [Kofleriaceae bacterium]
MFALPGITLLVVFVLLRPQEFVPFLQRLPFLHLFTILAVLGYVIDVRLRRLQPIAVNTLPWIAAFLIWAILCTAIEAPDTLVGLILFLVVLFALYGVIAHGIQRFRTFQIVAGTLTAAVVFLALVCAHQGFSPKQCVGGVDTDGAIDGVPDGRECEKNEECRGGEAEPDMEFRCEHVGLFGTYSVDERVRYRGELSDPNEVALAICSGGMAMLLGFALLKQTSSGRRLVYVAGIGLCVVAVFMTQSRGGLLAMVLVPGIYAIRKWGWSVVVPGGGLAFLVLTLGGRSGENADASTQQRYEAWSVGLDLWHHSPMFGVGARQFAAHHFLTAHNSFVLMLTELGIVGMFLFVAIIYLCMKTLIVGLKALEGVPGTQVAQVWGMSLLAAMAGIIFQINTLSFSYHMVLWSFFGLCGGWYGAVRHHKPDLEIKMTFIDVIVVALACVLYATIVLPIFLTAKGEM